MKTISLINNNVITGTLCAGATLFLSAGASADVLYDSEQFTGAINTFSSSGTPTPFVSSTQPLGQQIAFNSSGDLFVGNNQNGGGITEITPNGTATTFGFGFTQPSGVAVDSHGNVFVTNTHIGQIVEVAPNGSSESLFATGLDNPYNLTFNSQGNLFASDWGNGDIYEFGPGGMSIYASGFQHPVGMAFDNAGNLFIAVGGGTSSPGYIEEITSTGTTETFSTQVSSPIGLAFLPVPEPSTLALLAVGASAVVLRLRRKQ
jgi:glucose/arabinose dehydrogenase